jgi:hypothetical protein
MTFWVAALFLLTPQQHRPNAEVHAPTDLSVYHPQESCFGILESHVVRVACDFPDYPRLPERYLQFFASEEDCLAGIGTIGGKGGHSYQGKPAALVCVRVRMDKLANAPPAVF